MILDVLDDADAGNGVELPVEANGFGNVDVLDLPVAVGHARRPVVANVVDCRNRESAIAKERGPGRGAGSDIEHRTRTLLGQRRESESILHGPLVVTAELLCLGLRLADSIHIPATGRMNERLERIHQFAWPPAGSTMALIDPLLSGIRQSAPYPWI